MYLAFLAVIFGWLFFGHLFGLIPAHHDYLVIPVATFAVVLLFVLRGRAIDE